MNQKIMSFVALLTVCILSGQIYGVLIDQSQLDYEFTPDLMSGEQSGQTFTAGIDGDIIGIRLVVEGRDSVSSDIFGSDIQINLRSISQNASGHDYISDTILATGYRSRDGIEKDTPNWIEIYFDQPYHQSQGEKLVFTIQELSGGGANGWNEYGMSSSNPYEGGTQFYRHWSGGFPTSNNDMAFETIVTIPEPSTIMCLTIGAFFLKRKVTS